MRRKLILTTIAACILSSFLVIGTSAGTTNEMQSSGNANISVIDVSQYNVQKNISGSYIYSSIDWTTVKKTAGTVYIRASIKNYLGKIVADDCVTQNAAGAKAAGMNIGYYHYFRPSATKSTNTAQADFFYNTIKNLPYNCVPVIDVEDPHDCGQTSALSKSQITTAVQQFIDRFKSLSGREVMVYTYNSFIDSFLESSLSSNKLWIAKWSTTKPYKTSVWTRWDMWQYTDSGKIDGISGYVDRSYATSNIYLSNAIGITYVDKNPSTYGTGDITIKGWAISYYDVKRVDVYVDNKGIGSIYKANFTDNTGVNDLYGDQGYSDTVNCGYSITIPDGILLSGNHTVRAAMITEDGKILWSDAKTISVDIPQTLVNADSVKTNSNGDTEISGYALSPYGISSVDVYVDGAKKTTISSDNFISSNDLATKYADVAYFNKDMSRISYTLPRGTLTGGNHTVQLIASDTKGHTIKSSTVNYSYVVPQTKVHIDSPKSGTFDGDIKINGWALSYNTVNCVDVYVDGTRVKSIKNYDFTQRPDVEAYYSSSIYSDKLNSGYEYTLPDGYLKEGKHTLKVAMVYGNRQVLWSDTKTFYVDYPDERVHIDSPKSGTFDGAILVSGWSLSHDGVNCIDVYVDGTRVKSIKNYDFVERSDVAKVFSSYNYKNKLNSGYSYTIPDGYLKEGKHTLKVSMVYGDRKVKWSDTKTFTVDYPANRLQIDAPTGTYTGDVRVAGWALSHEGVNCVDVYIDGVRIKSVKNYDFVERGDVEKAFSSYNYKNKLNCGYDFTIPKGTLKRGKHTIKVAMIYPTRQVMWSSEKTFYIG